MDNPLLDAAEQISDNLPEPVLSDEQKALVLKRWTDKSLEPPSIPELIATAWPQLPNDKLDGRLKWGKVVRQYLSTQNIQALSAKELTKQSGNLELTQEQKDYIANNCATMSPLEMARVLFSNSMLSPSSNEAKIVTAAAKEIDPRILFANETPEFDYKAPNTILQALAKIRKYVSETEKWNKDALTSTQKKNCEMLIHYLHDHRFKRQMDSYESPEDKLTFESEFVKYTHNKSDLTQEEISQYISLCTFIVNEFNITSFLEMLKSQLKQERDDTGKITHTLVEAIESARGDLDACSKRQSALYNSLTEKRSEKVKGKLKDTASILNVIELWKQEESRKKMILIAKGQEEKLNDEINRLESMSDMICLIAGISREEVLHG